MVFELSNMSFDDDMVEIPFQWFLGVLLIVTEDG